MNSQEIIEEPSKNIEEFKSYWQKEQESRRRRKERIIRYRELAWYKGLSGVLTFILFVLFFSAYQEKLGHWSYFLLLVVVIVLVVIVPYSLLFKHYRESISRKPESEISRFIDSNEDTEEFTDDSESPRQPFYFGVTHKQSNRYQVFFDKAIESIDVDNLWSSRYSEFSRYSKLKPKKRKAKDDEKIIESILKEVEAEKELSPFFLKVMIEQYLWADSKEREADRKVWGKRVMQRNESDYFPPAEKISELLLKK